MGRYGRYGGNRPISVYRLGEMPLPIQSRGQSIRARESGRHVECQYRVCGQSVSARRGRRYTESGLLTLV